MKLIKLVEIILKEQKNSFKPIPVDITIENGNIILRSFRIYKIDRESNTIKGLTFQEEYIHPRENREPEYCILSFKEIKELNCCELDINFFKENGSV